MTQQLINIGSAPNDGTGDPMRNAFDKCNLNFTELYTRSSSVSGFAEYVFDTNTAPPPTSGEIRANNASIAATTALYFHNVTNNGSDIKRVLTEMPVGASLVIQDQGNNANFAKYNVTATPIDHGTYVEFPVTCPDSGGTLFNNTKLLVAMTGGGGGSTGITVNTTPITGGTSGNFLYDNAATVSERTPTQTTAVLDLFTSTLKGLAPGSGGGMANFLRADGTWATPSTGSATVLPNYLGGLTLSNDGVNPNTVVDIAIGGATSDDNAVMMTLTSAFTKTTGAWAVGSGNGGLDAGSIAASTWYHVFLIQRIDTGVTDVLLSTSATSPTYPPSYSKKRRIGSIKTNASSQITPFVQQGDEFLWATNVVEVSNGTVPTTATLLALVGVPTGVKVRARLRGLVYCTGGTANALFQSPDEVSQVASNSNTDVGNQVSGIGASYNIIVRVNTSAQVRWSASLANSGAWVSCFGWFDDRGR